MRMDKDGDDPRNTAEHMSVVVHIRLAARLRNRRQSM